MQRLEEWNDFLSSSDSADLSSHGTSSSPLHSVLDLFSSPSVYSFSSSSFLTFSSYSSSSSDATTLRVLLRGLFYALGMAASATALPAEPHTHRFHIQHNNSLYNNNTESDNVIDKKESNMHTVSSDSKSNAKNSSDSNMNTDSHNNSKLSSDMQLQGSEEDDEEIWEDIINDPGDAGALLRSVFDFFSTSVSAVYEETDTNTFPALDEEQPFHTLSRQSHS